MKRTMILPLLILCSAAVADAETYKWIDNQGVVSFTDDPSLIPSRYRSKALRGEYNNIRTPKIQKKLRVQKKMERQHKLKAPRIATTPDGVQTKPSPPPLSMKQPAPAPLGDQPTPTPLGMKQPKPAPLGAQPAPTPLGMKQPAPAPLSDQPTPTPLGMEQPTPAQ